MQTKLWVLGKDDNCARRGQIKRVGIKKLDKFKLHNMVILSLSQSRYFPS